METVEYLRMDAAEDQLWWYRSLHAYLIDAYQTSEVPRPGLVLDAGCGTGGLLQRLGRLTPSADGVGIDLNVEAARRAGQKSGSEVALASVNKLPFADRTFSAIFSADVLYHRSVDPLAASREAQRCLMPGGALFVNVPAFQWLSSYHDRQVHGARRFNRAGLQQLLTDAGFARIRIHYWNSLLFPVMVARRLMPFSSAGSSDVKPIAPPLNRMLAAVVAFERRLIRWGLRFPAGGSILAVGYKP